MSPEIREEVGDSHRRTGVLLCLVLGCVALVGCGSGATTNAPPSQSMSPTDGTDEVDEAPRTETVTEHNLDTCRHAVIATPIWASTDRDTARSVAQVARGSIGTITGRLVKIESGPTESANDIIPADVELRPDGGFYRAFDRFVLAIDAATGEVAEHVEAGDAVGILVPIVLGVPEAIDHRSSVTDRLRAACPPGMVVSAYVGSVDTSNGVADVRLPPIPLASVLLEDSDGSVRSLDGMIDGDQPLGITSRAEFLAAS